MLKKERRAFILQQVTLHNRVLSASLGAVMQVSEDTVRRDLQELAQDGSIIKVHGGALSPWFNAAGEQRSMVYAQDAKKKIAQKAVALIKDGMRVLTTGGTTVLEIARIIPPQLKATFISGSVQVIQAFMQHPSAEVIMIGGRLSNNAKVTVGAEAIASIQQLQPDLCLLGVNAIDLRHGITDDDWEVVEVKKAMLEAARETICLTISEKLGSFQPIRICELNKTAALVTELPPETSALDSYRSAGLKIL